MKKLPTRLFVETKKLNYIPCFGNTLCEAISEYLYNTYKICDKGFDYNDEDEFITGTIEVFNIEWDITEKE